MKGKKISYFIILVIIAAVLTGILTGCGKKEPEGEQIYSDTSKYAYEQTCPAGYDFDLPYKSEKTDKNEIFIFKAWPTDGNRKGKIEYRIYDTSWVDPCRKSALDYSDKPKVIDNLVNEESESYFNKFFLDEDNIPRDDFRFVKTDKFNPEKPGDEDCTKYTEIPHLGDESDCHRMYEMEYTFTKKSDDGKVTEWSGYCCPFFVHDDHMLYVIVFETETEIFAESRGDFDNLINGFKRICW